MTVLVWVSWLWVVSGWGAPVPHLHSEAAFALLADLDGDGLDEALVGDARESIDVYGGRAGPLQTDSEGRALFEISGAYEALAGDVTGDGLVDLVLRASSGWHVLAADGAALTAFRGTVSVTSLPVAAPYTVRPSIKNAGALVDLDGNQTLDLLVAGADGFAFHAGTGDGTFGAAVTTVLSAGLRFQEFALGDIDEDGQLDVVYPVRENTETVAGILLGQGDGTFLGEEPVRVGGETLGSAGSIELVDLDGDHHLDLVTRVASSRELTVASGDGRGAFAHVLTLSLEKDPAKGLEDLLLSGDVNGDGADDLIFGQGSVLIGNRAWGDAEPAYGWSSSPEGLLAAGDFNGDGYDDVIAQSALLFGSSEGLGSVMTSLLGTRDGGFSVSETRVGEITGDGHVDFIQLGWRPDGAVPQRGSVEVWISQGDGSMAMSPAVQRIAVDGVSSNVHMALLDADLDTDVDVVLLTSHGPPSGDEESSVSLHVNDGSGNFAAPSVIPQSRYARGSGQLVNRFLKSGDADADGHMDLFVVHELQGNGVLNYRVVLLRGRGDGTFFDPVEKTFEDSGSARWTDPVVEDLNGDGADDFLINLGDSLRALSWVGDEWEAEAFGDVSLEPTRPFVGDFNGDGQIDLLLGQQTAGGTRILWGLQDVTYPVSTGPPYGYGRILVRNELGKSPFGGCIPVGVADWNGDGLDDVVMQEDRQGAEKRLHIALSEGDGTFSPLYPGRMGILFHRSPHLIADVDGDGKEDVLGVLNNGSAHFFEVWANKEASAQNQAPLPRIEGTLVLRDHANVGSLPVILEAGGSTDVDGQVIAHRWHWQEQDPLDPQKLEAGSAEGSRLERTLPHGRHYYRLTVEDDGGKTATALAKLEVHPNQPPIAEAGEGMLVSDPDDPFGASVTLDGGGSSDRDGDIVAWEWTWQRDGTNTVTGARPTIDLPIGEHVITLTVTDDGGSQAVDAVHVSIGYTVRIASENPSHGEVNVIEKLVPFGGEIELEAYPEEGYAFDRWSGDVACRLNPWGLRVTGHMNVVARFVVTGEEFSGDPIPELDPVEAQESDASDMRIDPYFWVSVSQSSLAVYDLTNNEVKQRSWTGRLVLAPGRMSADERRVTFPVLEEEDGGDGGQVVFEVFHYPSLTHEQSVPAGPRMSILPSSWGFSPDGRYLIFPTAVHQSPTEEKVRYRLVDLEERNVVNEILTDQGYDRVIRFRKGGAGNEPNPHTAVIQGSACFVVARSQPGLQQAILEWRAWSSGEVKRRDKVEEGYFDDGVLEPHTGQWLYPSTVEPSILIFDFEAGIITGRLGRVHGDEAVPSSQGLSALRLSGDGDTLRWRESFSALPPVHRPDASAGVDIEVNNPFAPGDIVGRVFEDRNANGLLDIEDTLQGETPFLLYVLDLSGSTLNPFSGSSVGDVNQDGESNTILDAEIGSLVTYHELLASSSLGARTETGIIGFSSEATVMDLDGTSDSDEFIPTRLDTGGEGTTDVVSSLIALRAEGSTNFTAALQAAVEAFTAVQVPPGEGNLIFLSDGESSDDDFDALVEELQAMGILVKAIGVGQESSLSQLRRIDSKALQVVSTDTLSEVLLSGGLPGVPLYLDADGDGAPGAHEPFTASMTDDPDTPAVDEEGWYRFPDLRAGDWLVDLQPFSGWIRTSPREVTVHPVVASDRPIGVRPDPALSSYQGYAEAYFTPEAIRSGVGRPGENADGDWQPNFLEPYFLSDPTVGDDPLEFSPVLADEQGRAVMSVKFVRDPGYASLLGLRYRVEGRTMLGESGEERWEILPHTEEVMSGQGEHGECVTLTVNVEGDPERYFLRVIFFR